MSGEHAPRKHGGGSFRCLTRQRFPFAPCLMLGNAAEDMGDHGATLPTYTAAVNATLIKAPSAPARCGRTIQLHAFFLIFSPRLVDWAAVSFSCVPCTSCFAQHPL